LIKLVKTASGKQTVKMSKSEWQDIGKKAGWLSKRAQDSIGGFGWVATKKRMIDKARKLFEDGKKDEALLYIRQNLEPDETMEELERSWGIGYRDK